MCRKLPLDIIFPVRDAASAHLALMKAECLYAAGVIDGDAKANLAERVDREFRACSYRRKTTAAELDFGTTSGTFLASRTLNGDGRAKSLEPGPDVEKSVDPPFPSAARSR